MTDSFHIRPARTGDVPAIKKLVAPLAEQRILMAKETVAYYESLQEFRIAESSDGEVIGCGALHVMWEDLAEVRTLAASQDWRATGSTSWPTSQQLIPWFIRNSSARMMRVLPSSWTSRGSSPTPWATHA